MVKGLGLHLGKRRRFRSGWRSIAVVSCLLITAPVAPAQTTLPGTRALILDGDPAASMVDAIHTFLLRETAASVGRRAEFWHRDYRSPEAFERSISPNRERFRSIIGAVDPRLGVTELQLEATTGNSAEIAVGRNYRVYAVRWPVFHDVEAEGLLLEPDGAPRARIVAIPDAGWSPEMTVGLAPGIDAVCTVRTATRRERVPGSGPGAHRSKRHLVRHPRREDDQPDPPRVDLSDGLRSRQACHWVRSAESAFGNRLVRV